MLTHQLMICLILIISFLFTQTSNRPELGTIKISVHIDKSSCSCFFKYVLVDSFSFSIYLIHYIEMYQEKFSKVLVGHDSRGITYAL